MNEVLERSVPYVLDQMQIERRPCICGNPDCPSAATQARFYFFSRFFVGQSHKVLWWHGRN